MDGTPDRVSVNSLIILTNQLPFLAYSLRYVAAPMPSGRAIASDTKIINPVETKAGAKVTFALELAPNIKSHDR